MNSYVFSRKTVSVSVVTHWSCKLLKSINPILTGNWTYRNETQNILIRGMDVLWIRLQRPDVGHDRVNFIYYYWLMSHFLTEYGRFAFWAEILNLLKQFVISSIFMKTLCFLNSLNSKVLKAVLDLFLFRSGSKTFWFYRMKIWKNVAKISFSLILTIYILLPYKALV